MQQVDHKAIRGSFVDDINNIRNTSATNGIKVQVKNSYSELEILEQKRKLLQQQRRNIIKAAARMREFQRMKNRVRDSIYLNTVFYHIYSIRFVLLHLFICVALGLP